MFWATQGVDVWTSKVVVFALKLVLSHLEEAPDDDIVCWWWLWLSSRSLMCKRNYVSNKCLFMILRYPKIIFIIWINNSHTKKNAIFFVTSYLVCLANIFWHWGVKRDGCICCTNFESLSKAQLHQEADAKPQGTLEILRRIENGW